MDSKYRPNARLIDVVEDEWRADRLPHEDIQVPLEELPDPEADSADSHLTLKEQSMRWQENFPETEQINIRDQLPKYLNGQAKLLTTRCIIIETEKIAKKAHGALTILKQFGTHECSHKEPVPGSRCILSMVARANEKHYVIASQDRDLQEKLRKKAGVPILYLHNKSPTLEKPSKVSYNKVNPTTEANSITFITKTQNETLKKMKIALGVEGVVEGPITTKKKKSHNPNPLSCRKKKKKTSNPGVTTKNTIISDGNISKRKRKKSNPLKQQLVNTLGQS